MFKKGDTLVEVTIAIGIFSMIAIAITAVMSSGVSGSQSALETTLAREEIDAQAEALRFIHDAYLDNKSSESNPYATLWQTIKDAANTPSASVTEYNPSSCQELYGDPLKAQNAFILNTKNLDNTSAFISAKTSPDKFGSTTTYPRVLYGGAGATSLVDSTNSKNLFRAEGVYVVGVKDQGTNMVVDGSHATSTSAFYDFYIRTCWYGLDAERPSTISTVIRLYDAPVAKSTSPIKSKYLSINYNSGGVTSYFNGRGQEIAANSSNNILGATDSNLPYAWRLQGWQISDPTRTYRIGDIDKIYAVGEVVTVPEDLPANEYWDLKAVWDEDPSKIIYNANGGTYSDNSTEQTASCAAFSDCESNYQIDASIIPRRSGYRFIGWAKDRNASSPQYPKNSTAPVYVGALTSKETILYAVWEEYNERITVVASWTGDSDYDSYMMLQKPDNSYLNANYSTIASSVTVTFGGQTYPLVTGIGDGRGSYNNIRHEDFVIYTLGAKNYYYSIRRWPDGNIGDDITIKVTGQHPETGSKTFYSRNRPNSSDCNYWNVFAFKDGEIVEKNTCSSSMEYRY